MSAMVTSYVTEQLSSPAFLQSVTYKIAANPKTNALVSEKAGKHAPAIAITFVASSLLGSILYRKIFG